MKNNISTRILLVDHSSELTGVLGDLFFQNGLQAETIWIDGREKFFAALRDRDFRLILADADGLPGLNLSQTLELTRHMLPDVPVLVLDRVQDERDRAERKDREGEAATALSNGATDYLFHSQIERLVPIIGRLARERAARLLHEEMEEKVERFADSMRESQKLATIGRLSATIAHEINNPLESITNLLYLINQDQSLSRQGHAFVEMAQQELSRVAQISRQTLVFSRESPVAVRVQPKELLESVLTLYMRRLKDKEIEVIRQYESEDATTVFPGEMRQVFSNLIANAIEASPAQSKLYVRVRRTRQWTDQNVTGLRITVADTGSGIPREVRARLGEPFFTTKGQSGTGLGLWVTQGILKRYGGNLQWHSSTNAERHGTVFSVFLPTNLRPAAIPAGAGSSATGATARQASVATMVKPEDRSVDKKRSLG